MGKKIIKGQHVKLQNTGNPAHDGQVVVALHDEYPDGGLKVRPKEEAWDFIYYNTAEYNHIGKP